MRLISRLKSLVVVPGSRRMRIVWGAGRGMWLKIDPASKSQRLFGLEEREIADAVLDYARRAGTIVDVGANDGYYTTLAAVRNPAAKVIAVDPEPRMRELCAENLALNGLALDGRISFLAEFVGTGGGPNTIALDRLLETAAEPVFLKIDVDGPELDVLKSAERTLTDRKCLLVVETHGVAQERDCLAYLRGLSYTCRVVKNAWWRIILPEMRPIEHNRWFVAYKET